MPGQKTAKKRKFWLCGWLIFEVYDFFVMNYSTKTTVCTPSDFTAKPVIFTVSQLNLELLGGGEGKRGLFKKNWGWDRFEVK